ncbi:MAG: putative recombination protein [Prokaryotic dsDNA virus sp.]|nr:MAG: putative recombination protein [Prokaryotic dsDNA virus sp.]|tara:strand:- start:18025 stop:19059 length:1035 start_codon:yes stop_codon:yes gene_type:complete
MNQVATQQRTSPVVQFKKDLDALNGAGELALPDTVDFKAFKNAAVVAITDNPSILQCDKQSVFKAIRTLAGAGLVPDGREAAIVPFKGQAQAMPMVAGIVKVARNSGKISSLWAEVVYEGESLEVWVEDGERKWNHVKEDGSRINAMTRGGQIIGAYAVAKMTDKTVDFQPMSFEEIEQRRKASSNQRSPNPTGIWEKWYGEMAKKTVIRNLCKRLPMSTEDIERIMKEQDQTGLKDITPDEPKADRKNLAQTLAEQQNQSTEPETPEETGDAIEGEIMEPEEKPSGLDLSTLDLSQAFPGNPEFDMGVKAFGNGNKLEECPFQNPEKATDWCGGFTQAQKAAE